MQKAAPKDGPIHQNVSGRWKLLSEFFQVVSVSPQNALGFRYGMMVNDCAYRRIKCNDCTTFEVLVCRLFCFGGQIAAISHASVFLPAALSTAALSDWT